VYLYNDVNIAHELILLHSLLKINKSVMLFAFRGICAASIAYSYLRDVDDSLLSLLLCFIKVATVLLFGLIESTYFPAVPLGRLLSFVL